MQLSDVQVMIIKRTENGFIVCKKLVDSMDGKDVDVVEVIEEAGNLGEEEKIAMTSLLYKVADWYGVEYDKYSKTNLNITFDKKGYKVMNEADEEIRVDPNLDMDNRSIIQDDD